MSLNLVTLLYLVASVCFIQALKGLSHPTTSIRGNVFGMSGGGAVTRIYSQTDATWTGRGFWTDFAGYSGIGKRECHTTR